MNVALKEELISNGGFEHWVPMTNTHIRPVNWANAIGDAFTGLWRSGCAHTGNYSLRLCTWTEVLCSNIMPVTNEAGVQYTLSFWYLMCGYSSGYGAVRLVEYDNEMNEINVFSPLSANSDIGWTQITKTVSDATSSADYKLNVDTKYLRLELFVYDTPPGDAYLEFYLDDFILGDARGIELDRGYIHGRDITVLVGNQIETSGGNLLGIAPHNTQNEKSVSFIGFKEDHDRLINFLESPEVQYGKYPFWLRDEDGNWSLVRYVDDVFKSESPNHGVYDYGFSFEEEI